MPKVIEDVIKISVGVVTTVFLTVFFLGVINGSTGKDYGAKDIPGVGWALNMTDSAGKAIGEKMSGSAPAVSAA